MLMLWLAIERSVQTIRPSADGAGWLVALWRWCL